MLQAGYSYICILIRITRIIARALQLLLLKRTFWLLTYYKLAECPSLRCGCDCVVSVGRKEEKEGRRGHASTWNVSAGNDDGNGNVSSSSGNDDDGSPTTAVHASPANGASAASKIAQILAVDSYTAVYIPTRLYFRTTINKKVSLLCILYGCGLYRYISLL